MLGYSKSTISRMVADGRLDPVDKLQGLRGAFLFRREDIDAAYNAADLKAVVQRRVPRRSRPSGQISIGAKKSNAA